MLFAAPFAVAAPTSNSAANTVRTFLPPEIAALPREMRKLPIGIQSWYVYETSYLSREVDTDKLSSPAQNDQDPKFAPEAKEVFDLLGVWVPAKQMLAFESGGLTPELRNEFQRSREGHSEYLFLIHPESKSLYPKLLNQGFDQENFRAVATASSRSLLVWKTGHESHPFIAKVSLNKMIGYVTRTIKGTETARSVGTSKLLEGAADLPANAIFLMEPFSLIPKGLATGGMIVRQFPVEFLDGETQFLPLFALYGGEGEALLWDLIKRSGKSPHTYIREEIIRPFVQLWAQLAVEEGILMEPHAQNMLMEIKNGRLTERFAARDFGGFNIDFKFRRKTRKFVPKNLPNFTGNVDKDYFQASHGEMIFMGMYNYFEAGFLYNLEQKLRKGLKNGHLSQSEFDKNPSLHDLLLTEINSALSQELGRPANVTGDFVGIQDAIEQAQTNYTPRSRLLYSPKSCREIFRN
jgi:hypothetical protein